ncbi:MBG domain-containing protein [uncultured Algoriphagus sp.]|uniref:MBG domain-containing protein n=1 Tax=uncultured Algoriphagus sp. TaxID=417365 RepID=UPI0030EEB16B
MKQFNFFLAAFLLILSNSFLTIAQDYQPSHSNKSVSEVELSGQKEKILETDNYAIGSKLSYIINQGQWDGEVLFMANGAGFRLWVTQKSLVYEFMASSASDSTMLGHVVKMNFDLAQAGYISAGKESSGVVNFFNGSDRSKWIEKVPQFGEITLSELYDGISLRLYGENGMPRYDLIVEPGADLSQIKFSLDGAENVLLNQAGDLSYLTSLGEIRQTDLFTYQVVDGVKQEVASAFSVKENGQVGFEIGSYDNQLPLIIDPLIYSTFIGTPSTTIPGASSGVLKVEDGFVYLSGITSSTTYPTTAGAYRTDLSEGSSALYVTKLNKTGTDLIYSTFLGEGAVFMLGDMAVENGFVYLSGTAYDEFPTTANAYQESFSDGGKIFLFNDPETDEPFEDFDPPILSDLSNPTDAFVTKLALDGGSLVYSTYLGGAGVDYGNAITVENGVVFVTGGSGPQKETQVPFPTTANVYQRENGFGFLRSGSEVEDYFFNLTAQYFTDVFVSKLSQDGSQLLYSTLIGNEGAEMAYDLTVKDGSPILSGTSNLNFPTTPDAFMPDSRGGNDLFLLRMNESATELEYSTLIGTSGEEMLTKMERDEDDLYLLGTTDLAADFPNTPGSYQDSKADFRVPYLMKFSNLGENLVFSTFVGSLVNGADEFTDLKVENRIPYLAGQTTHPGFFTTPGAYQETYIEGALSQAFVMQVNPTGENLTYSTLFGGGATYANSVGVENGIIYLKGYSLTLGFPVTDGAYNEALDVPVGTFAILDYVTAFDFGIGQHELGAPSLISPANLASKIPIRPSFSWEPASNATSSATPDYHDFQVSTTEDFSSEVIPRIASAEGTLNLNVDLGFGTKYYWRVRGVSALSTSEWSETFSFVTAPSKVGDGTEANPWEIATPEQLHAVRSYLSDHFKVVADIDLSEVTREGGKYWNDGVGWSPIGDGSAPFTGSISGGGFALDGAYINNSTANNVGIFGVIKNGSVNRLAILNPEISGGTVVGALAGLVVGGTIQECYAFEGSMSGDFFVGGLIGVLQNSASLLENSYSYLEVRQKIDPIPSGGGLVGNTQAGIIRNVYSLSTVAGEPVNNGAVLGTGSPAVVQSYFNSELAGPDNEKGIGLTSAAMREQSSFENWDFADVWKIEEDRSFPVLIHNEQIPAPGLLDGMPDLNNILYVDQSVVGGLENGNSWENAFLNLQSALNYAAIFWEGKEEVLKIYVAKGAYFPTDDSDASITFQLINNVSVYGGFPSGGGNFEARDWEANQTILSGDIINRTTIISDNAYTIPTGNSLHVVTGSGTDQTASLDGFFITAGYAIGDGSLSDGAGMLNENGSPSLSNLIFIGNRSSRYGGGMANLENSSPALTNVIFESNVATNAGGAVYNNLSSPDFTQVRFIKNLSSINGGGMYNQSSSAPRMTNVDFIGNEARGGVGTGIVGGGALYNSSDGVMILTNVRFSGNKATNSNGRGGAILNNGASPILTNVSISGNAAYSGGGVYNTSLASQPKIRNSIIWNNKTNAGVETATSSLYDFNNSSSEVSYSLIQGVNPAGEGNLDGTDAANDPLFIEAITDFNTLTSVTGDFRVETNSPIKNKGSNQYFDASQSPDLSEVTTDLDLGKRIIGNVDLGAYEFQEELIELTITVASGQSKTFGEADPDFLYESSLPEVLLTGNLDRVPGEAPGAYQVTQGSLRAPDAYQVVFVGAEFEISKMVLIGIELNDQSFAFDGSEKSLTVGGLLPEGAIIDFINNSRTIVGIQEVTATISGDSFITLVLKANLEISPGEIEGITLDNKSFPFDGSPKSLELTGALPEGTSVEFTNNSRTEEGTQEVTATITGSNYITKVLRADLTISESRALEVTVEKENPSAYGAMDGAITLLIEGGVQPYTVTWIQPVGPGPVLTGLGAGLYEYLVVDIQGLEFRSSVELIHPKSTTMQSEFIADPSTNSCELPFTVNFTDRSSLPEWWKWDFGDGTILGSGDDPYLKNPTHTYTDFGDYTVKLAIQDTNSGEWFISSKIIRVLGVAAEFNSDIDHGCGPLSVQFTDQSKGAVSWLWDFGDGNTSSDQNPAHTYDLPGRYSVKLTTTSENGCIDTEIKSDFIQVIGPKVDFLSNVTAGCGPLTVAFTDNTYSGSPIVSYLWNFGDGTSSRSANPSHTYTQVGSYTVSLQVSVLDGCSNTLIKSELVRVGGPKISIAKTDVSCNEGADGTATVSIEEGTGPFTYEWTPYGGSEASATGLSAGNYEVQVTDGNGCVSIENVTIDQPDPSEVTTVSASAVTFSSAILGGSIISYGVDCESEIGVVYSMDKLPELTDSKVLMSVNSGAFSAEITGLSINTTYYVRAFFTNVNGEATYGNEIEFTTAKKELVITPDENQSKSFGDADPEFTYSATGFAGDDEAEDVMEGSLSRATGESVGTYEIEPGSLNAGANYTISFGSGTLFTITPAKIEEITFSEASFTYDGTEQSLEITGDLPDGTSVEYTNNGRTGAGTHEVTATITGSNFTTLELKADLTITPATVTVRVDSGQSKVFGEADPELTYTNSTLVEGNTIEGSLSRAAGESVGTYEIELGSLTAGANYTISFASETLFTITPAEVEEITFSAASFTYDGTEQSLEITGDLPDGTSVEYTNNGRTGAGTQEVTATITGSNFTTLELKADLTITPATVTVRVDSGQSKVFGEADPELTYTNSTLVEGNTIEGSLSRAAGESVGTYEIELGSLTAGANYTISFASETLFTITPAEVEEITFSAASFTYDGTEQSIEITGDLPDGTSVEYTGNGRTNAGTQEVTATITGSNFTTLELKAELTITPATVTVTVDSGQSKVFGGADPELTYTNSTLVEGNTIEGSLSRAAGESVGTYEVELGSLNAGANYTISFASGTLFTITPAEVEEITFSAASFTYDGTEQSIEITGDLPDGTSVEYTGNGRTNAGTQEVTATITGSNFTTLELKADLTITPATVTVTADSGQSKVFGEADPELTYTNSTLVEGNTIEGSLSRATGESVGTYEIELGSLTAGDNYTINYIGADFEITKATLNITADAGQTKIYGEADPTFTYSAIGFQNEDDEFTLTGGLSRVMGENVGDYAINLGTMNAGGNYLINFTSAEFVITPRTLNVMASPNQAKVYGFSDPELAYTASNFGAGDTAATLTGVLSRNSGENVGLYPINLGSLSAGLNYTIDFTSAEFEIATKVLNVTAEAGQSKVFGTSDPDFTYRVNGFENRDNNSILTGTLARAAGENVGSFAINLGTLSAGANYAINYLGADFMITKAKISGIIFEDQTFTYDGTSKSLAISGTLPTGTSVAYSNNGRTDVGTQEVMATISGSNYTTLVLTADLTVIPAAIGGGITFEDQTFTYDGTSKSLAISGTLPLGTSVAYSNNGRPDVGTQEVTATISGSNYTTLVLTADLTVIPAAIGGITFEDQTFIYDGTSKSLAISGTLPSGASVAYSNNSRTEVGTQEVTAMISGANFTEVTLIADLTINPATLMVMADEGQGKEFGMEDPALTYQVSGLQGADIESIVTGTLSRASGEEVGSYAIIIGTLDAGANYTIDFIGADFVITEEPNVDSDGDGVPDKVEEEQGTDPHDPTDYPDADNDGVPDYVEEQHGTDPTNPSDYLDTDEDGVPDYVETQQGTDPTDVSDFEDEDDDGIPDYVHQRSISEFVGESIEVRWRTEAEELKVPTQVVAMTQMGAFINVPVIWDLEGYDPLMSGVTQYLGSIELPAGLFNPQGLQPKLEITVLAKPAPQDVTLSANSFIGIPDQYFQEIGAFTVIDPTDNIHTLSLPEGTQDNNYFEVLDGILFWSTAEQAGGRTEFTILLSVSDRAGNVLEKSFQITRQRTPLEQLGVPNTFTPNADGVNDTWGVLALRYYTGVKISVMDLGGDRVFYTENPDVQWDGTFNGKEMPVGSYLFVIEVRETGEIRRGMLNLLRQ